jgi:hypothetical protein
MISHRAHWSNRRPRRQYIRGRPEKTPAIAADFTSQDPPKENRQSTISSFSADILPLLRSATSSKDTLSPSRN